MADSIASIARGAEQAAGEAITRATDVKSNVTRELGARPEGTEPSTPAPESDDHEQDAAEEPKDDTGVIDVPLETEPRTPPIPDGD